MSPESMLITDFSALTAGSLSPKNLFSPAFAWPQESGSQ